MPNNIRVLGHTSASPPPFNMTVLLISINQRGGMKLEINSSGAGIFFTGKINPDNRILGSINTKPDIAKAVT